MTMRLKGQLSRKMTEHHADMRNEATRTAISAFSAALLPVEFPQNYPGRELPFSDDLIKYFDFMVRPEGFEPPAY
jgi:hypothetical protein